MLYDDTTVSDWCFSNWNTPLFILIEIIIDFISKLINFHWSFVFSIMFIVSWTVLHTPFDPQKFTAKQLKRILVRPILPLLNKRHEMNSKEQTLVTLFNEILSIQCFYWILPSIFRHKSRKNSHYERKSIVENKTDDN